MALYSLKKTTCRQVLKRSRNATTGTARSRTMESTTLRVTVHPLSASLLVASINLVMASLSSAHTPIPLVSRSSPSLTRKRVAISKLVFSFMVVASGKEEGMHSFTQLLIAYLDRHTWFDRDLSLAGRVMVEQEDGTYRHTLVKINR